MDIVINANAVAVVSAGIALGSAIISWRNLCLQKKIYKERRPDFRMNELVDSYAVYDDANNIVKLMFYPLIVNMSSKPMVLEKIRLNLVGEDQTVVLCPIVDDSYINDGHNIASNNADTSWICFEIGQDSYKNLRVLKYELEVEDVYHNIQKVSTAWLKEMVSANERVH